eukprot:365910-Chlamydomonas_euryale.AAC.24
MPSPTPCSHSAATSITREHNKDLHRAPQVFDSSCSTPPFNLSVPVFDRVARHEAPRGCLGYAAAQSSAAQHGTPEHSSPGCGKGRIRKDGNQAKARRDGYEHAVQAVGGPASKPIGQFVQDHAEMEGLEFASCRAALESTFNVASQPLEMPSP